VTKAPVKQRTNVAIVGLGRMGALHARNLATTPATRLVYVVDEQSELANRIAAELDSKCSNKLDVVLADPAIEAVVIASPSRMHLRMVSSALAAGKHVFCEKPLALTPEDIRQLLTQARATRRLVQVGFHRRFDPDWMAARERLRAGELGRPYLFRSTLREREPPSAGYIASAGSFFADFTIHDLDAARWLLGEEIVEVQAFAAALSDPRFELPASPDQVVVVVRFAGGALGVIDNSRTAGYGYECAGEVLGERATARIGERQTRHNVELLTRRGAMRDYQLEFHERFAAAYRAEIEHFVGAVRGRLEAEATGEDALAALELAIAADRSLNACRPVTVDAVRRVKEADAV
jgi:predicted dehydrogenase